MPIEIRELHIRVDVDEPKAELEQNGSVAQFFAYDHGFRGGVNASAMSGEFVFAADAAEAIYKLHKIGHTTAGASQSSTGGGDLDDWQSNYGVGGGAAAAGGDGWIEVHSVQLGTTRPTASPADTSFDLFV